MKGNLVTDGYKFYVVVDIHPYNGKEKQILELLCLEQCPNTGVWGYWYTSNAPHRFRVLRA